MGLQRFPIGKFDGGINFRDGPFQLEANELQDGMNVRLTQRGALTERKGKTRFDASGFPAAKRAEHMRNWYFGSTRLLMLSIDGTIYSCNTGGALTSRFAGTAASTWCFESMQDSLGADTLWAMNGVDAAKRWDGAAGSASAWGGTPPNGTMCKAWRNRMVVAGVPGSPRRLFFSDIGNPEAPSGSYGTNWVDIKQAEDDLDPITWLDTLGDLLLVFKRRSVWAVYDDATFRNRRIGAVGCEDRFQSVEAMGRTYFLARDGVYSLDGVTGPPVLESGALGTYFPDTIDYSVIGKARIGATRDRRLLVALPTSGSVNSRLLEYQLDFTTKRTATERARHPWFIHDLGVSSMAVFRPVNTDVLIGGDSGAAKLHTLFLGTSDDGVAINAYGLTGWKSFISEEPYERVRRLNVEMVGNLIVDVFLDLDAGVVKYSKALDANPGSDAVWDGGTWDGGVWDAQAGTQLRRARPETRGRYHAYKFRNSQLNKTFTIYAAEAAIRGGKEH
jgi:hypothetical protein